MRLLTLSIIAIWIMAPELAGRTIANANIASARRQVVARRGSRSRSDLRRRGGQIPIWEPGIEDLSPWLDNDRALVALQHDILVVVWRMLTNDQPYRGPGRRLLRPQRPRCHPA